MYNLVSCYDSLEMKARGDVLSDKVYLGDQEGEGEGLRISQSESILTDMTHVISPMSFNGKSPMLQQYQAISKWKAVCCLLSAVYCLLARQRSQTVVSAASEFSKIVKFSVMIY